MSVTAVQGRLGQFSPARFGAGLGASRRAVRSFRVGSAADRQQLAGDPRNRRAARSQSRRATRSRCRCGPSRRTTSNCWASGMLEGREFRSTDDGKAPNVAIVNQAFADRYFPHADPIGKKLWLNGREKPAYGNCRRGLQWPHRRLDAGGVARDLSVLVAGLGVFQAPGDPNDGRPALADGRGATRAARRRSHRRRRKPEDSGTDSRRFAGVPHVRDAVAGRVFGGGERADAGWNLWRAFALGGLSAARARDSHRGRRRAEETFGT